MMHRFVCCWSLGILLLAQGEVMPATDRAIWNSAEAWSAWHCLTEGDGACVPGQDRVLLQVLEGDQATFRCDIPTDQRNWLAFTRISLLIRSDQPAVIRVGVTGLDTEAYRHPDVSTIGPSWRKIELELSETWEGVGHGGTWNVYSRHYVRQLQIEIDGEAGTSVEVKQVTVGGQVTPGQAALLWQRAPSADRRQGQLATLRFQASPRVQNPYAPEVAIGAMVTGPDGQSAWRPAFFQRDYRLEKSEGKEVAIPAGAYHWAVRWYLREAGTYHWQIMVNGQALDHGAGRLVVERGSSRGFARLTREGSGGFEFEDGSFFYPIGLNACWPADPEIGMVTGTDLPDNRELSIYDEWYARMAAHGINTSQLWMIPFWTALEWSALHDGYGGIGIYSQRAAWKLDYLLDLARKHDIHLLLTLRNHQQFFGTADESNRALWAGNPWSKANGGPLAEAHEWFTNEQALQENTNYLRYCLARWGEDPQILAFVAMSETDNAIAGKISKTEVIRGISYPQEKPLLAEAEAINAWLETCLQVNRELGDRPLLVGNCRQHQLLANQVYHHEALPLLLTDFYIFRRDYTATAAQGMHHAYNDLRRHHKLNWVTETGFSGQGELPHEMAATMHETYWSSSMLPMVGTAMYWWWNQVFAEDLLPVIEPVTTFWQGEDRREQRLEHRCGLTEGRIHRLLPDGREIREWANYYRYLFLTSEQRSYGFVFPRSDAVYYEGGRRVAVEVTIDLQKLPIPQDSIIEFWHTRTGKVIERRLVEAHTKTLVAPDFHETIAFKLYPLPTDPVDYLTAPKLTPVPPETTLLRQVLPFSGEPPADVAALEALDLTVVNDHQRCAWRQVNDQFNPWRKTKEDSGFVSIYTGQLHCPLPGRYTFATDSDDASFLWIDEELIVSWPGAHGPTLPENRQSSNWEHRAEVDLTAGPHAFKYVLVNGEGASLARAAWQPPDQAELAVIPPDAFIP